VFGMAFGILNSHCKC